MTALSSSCASSRKPTTRRAGIESVRQDRAVYDLPPGEPRPAWLARPAVFGAPDFAMLDLPQLREDIHAHSPLVAASARPWPGRIPVWRSPGADGFELLTTFGGRARMGVLAADLFRPGGSMLVVDLLSGTLESVTDLALFGGANALVVESAPGQWEVLQAGYAELPGRYRLTRLHWRPWPRARRRR